VRQQHRVNVFADNHASRRLVGELRIEGVSQRRKKRDGFLQVFDRQVHKDFRSHKFSFLVFCENNCNNQTRCALGKSCAAGY
jgi:hypothetical protein